MYSTFRELVERSKSLKLCGWSIEYGTNHIFVKKEDSDYMVPKFYINIDDSLEFSISVYGWLLPVEHPLYLKNRRSMRHISISNLVHDLGNLNICNGLSFKFDSQHTINHVIPKAFNWSFDEFETPFHRYEYCRALNCQVLYTSSQCEHCLAIEKESLKFIKKLSNKMKTPAKLNAPISKTSPGRLKLALQQQRLKCQQLQEELQRMRTELSTNAVPVDNELNNDLLTILDNNESEMTHHS